MKAKLYTSLRTPLQASSAVAACWTIRQASKTCSSLVKMPPVTSRMQKMPPMTVEASEVSVERSHWSERVLAHSAGSLYFCVDSRKVVD